MFASIFREKERIASVIYGKIVVTALIVAMEGGAESALTVTLELFVSTLALLVAHGYASMLAKDIARGKLGNWSEFIREVKNALPIMAGINGPTIVFLMSHLGMLSLANAFLLAKTTALGLLFIYGILLGKAMGKDKLVCIIVGIINTALGFMVLAVKVVAH